TYHHSLVVGSLSEAGAEAVGGNPLLARVSAYYHDIGKIDKAEYYVENQSSARSRHEKLSPTMSCLIVEAHVREGAEIARREKLPTVILNAIQQHHGTTLMSFFYHKAKQADPDAEERDFRYPGPKPRSKETAVLMLADAVEAAARSLTEPTPSRIRGVPRASVSLVLTSDERIRTLNRDFLETDRPTDVLSFPLADPGDLEDRGRELFLGEIYISVDTARAQARAARRPYRREVAHLAIHGLLHLLGYDHATAAARRRMTAIESRLLREAAPML